MARRKDDYAKLPMYLVPPECEDFHTAVLQFGMIVYEENNWMGLDRFNERYYSANRRHLNKRRAGEMFDFDSGLPHSAHAMCCCMFLLWKDLMALPAEQRRKILADVPRKAKEYADRKRQADQDRASEDKGQVPSKRLLPVSNKQKKIRIGGPGSILK